MTLPLALRAARREFVRAGLLSLAINLLMLVPTLYMLQVYDRVLVSRNELTLLAVSVITLALFGVMAASEWLRVRALVGASVRLDQVLGPQVMDASFGAARAGAGAMRPLADLVQLRQFLTGSGILSFFDAPWTPVYLAVLFVLHPALGLAALAFIALQGLLAWQGHHRSVAPAEAASAAARAESAFLRAKLQGAETLEAMGMVENLWRRWQGKHQDHLERGAALQALTHRVTAASKFVRYTQQSFALGLGALLVIDGELTVGAMIAANVLMTRALAPIDQLAGSWRNFIGARGAFRRLQSLLAAHGGAGDAQAPQGEPALRGDVRLRGVSAFAPGRAQAILEGIDLHLAPGSVTAVVGPSGAGKSTLARVLVGAWPETTGEVLFDGMPAAGRPLGAQLGYLPQDVKLFDGTLADNIARFHQPDTQQVIAAARLAGLHEAILRLPLGYDTVVAGAAAALPGGLQQRIALARAVYGSPALVVLDEPNAHLDEAGEAALADLVRRLKTEGKTVLLVTHRPAILAAVDRLLVLRDGRIERDGAPDAVIAAVRLAAAQAQRPRPPLAPAELPT